MSKKKQVQVLSSASKLAQFDAFMMAHPFVEDVFERILNEIDSPLNSPIVFVAGPTGVGKSTLFNRLFKKVIDDEMKAMLADAHYLPISGMEVIAYDGGQFRWQDFHNRYLKALMEPMIEKKIKTYSLSLDELKDKEFGRSNLKFSPGLRRAVEKALDRRRVKVFLLDEAQHFAKVRGGQRLLDQLDYIKSLANTSGVKHVLFGTYQMLYLWNLSGQLARRSNIIHFPRYHTTNTKEKEIFQNIIATFEAELPLPEKGDLVENWEDIYVRCAGCVGILKLWMHRVLAVALQRKIPAMEYKLMEKYSLTAKQLQKIADEILVGETQLSDTDTDYLKAKMMLMQDATKKVQIESPELEQNSTKKKYKRRVGQRNPTRDKVGRSCMQAPIKDKLEAA